MKNVVVTMKSGQQANFNCSLDEYLSLFVAFSSNKPAHRIVTDKGKEYIFNLSKIICIYAEDIGA